MKWNAALLLAARVVSALTTLAVLAFVARDRGGEELGLVSVGLAIGGWLAAAADAGTGSLYVREAAREPGRAGRLLGAFTLWRLASLPVAICGLALLLLVAYPEGALAILLPAAGLAIQQFAELTRAVFIARQQMVFSSVHSIVENVAWMATVIGALMVGLSLETAFGLGVAALAASVLAGRGLDAVAARVHLAVPSRAEARELFRAVVPFAAFGILGVGYTRIDTVLVAALLPREGLVAAGAYFATARVLAALEYLPEAVSRSLYPELSRTFVTKPAEIRALLQPAARFLLVVGVPIPLATLVAGGTPITLLLGTDYSPYAWLLVALAAVVPIRYLGYLFGVTLTSTDAQGRRVLAVSLALVLTVGLNALLVPRIGITGAVVTTFAAAVVVFAVYRHEVNRRFGSVELARPLVVTAASAVAAALIALVARPVLTEPGSLGVFLVAYVLALGATRSVPLLIPLRRPRLHGPPPA